MSAPLRFTFEGREVVAREGQSIGAALLAAGVRTLGWSAKYRRPRGLRCARGACPSCQVRVNGLPGVAACMTPVCGRELVEREKPAGSRLPLGAVERFVHAGFHHAPWLARPRVWRRAEPLLATLAGVSRPPRPGLTPVGTFAERRIGLLVVGTGERGLRAAADAAASGVSVLVIDRDFAVGGRLLDAPGGADVAEHLAGLVRAAGAEILTGATALGGDPGGAWGIALEGGLLIVRPERVELATGRWDRELSLPDGDRPGVMTAGAVRRLLTREEVVPGRRAVVVSTVDGDDMLPALLAGHGIPVAARCGPAEIEAIGGSREVRGVRIAGRDIACDLVVIDAGMRPADELARQPNVLIHPGAAVRARTAAGTGVAAGPGDAV